jgi:dihydroflavonol-4-reductase
MILVTGANGFLGSHLLRALSDSGTSVRALYHRKEPSAEMRSWPGVSWEQADLLDIFRADEVMEGISEVYHCAAIVSFNPDRRAEMIHANETSTAHVVDAALQAGVRKLVHISSVAALGRDGTKKVIDEEAQWEESTINSGYGHSKYAAEMEVWRGIGEGLDAVILNPGIILGAPLQPEGWDDGSAKMMQTAAKEFPFYTDGCTSFVDIRDVVNAAIQLMESDISAERFILSAGNIPFREIFNEMAAALEKRPPSRHAGAFATGLVWRWESLKARFSGKHPLITRETARNAQSKSFYNNEKLLKVLPGFSYTPIPESIRDMAKVFRRDHAEQFPKG